MIFTSTRKTASSARDLERFTRFLGMAVYRATAEPNLWFAGAVTESPSEARLRRGAAYLERRQEEREARDRTYLAAAGMPGGHVNGPTAPTSDTVMVRPVS